LNDAKNRLACVSGGNYCTPREYNQKMEAMPDDEFLFWIRHKTVDDVIREAPEEDE